MRQKRSEKQKKCLSVIKKACGSIQPVAYIVTGSGQKRLSDFFRVKASIPFSKLPGYTSPTVKGHSDRLDLCESNGCFFLMQCGRNHLYETNTWDDILFPCEIVNLLGITFMLLLNSAGAVNRTYGTGDIMLIKDQINLMGRNPLFGRSDIKGNERFVSMRPCYDPDFLSYVMKRKGRIKSLKTGVYAGVIGPVYETEAELGFLEMMKADVVGMSTIQEAIYARFLGLNVSGASVISNSRKSLADHDDVIRKTDQSIKSLAEIIQYYLEFIS